jgi:ketosteroid isomerase-like protein
MGQLQAKAGSCRVLYAHSVSRPGQLPIQSKTFLGILLLAVCGHSRHLSLKITAVLDASPHSEDNCGPTGGAPVKQIAVSVALLMITGTLMFAQSAIGDVEQSIKSMENEMREAVLKGDAVGSAKYLGSNYVRVYPDGSVASRQQAIDDVKNSLKYTSIEVTEQQVQVTGNTAISVFKASVKGTRNGQPIDGDYRGVRTWVKEGGQWKAVAFASTKIGAM